MSRLLLDTLKDDISHLLQTPESQKIAEDYLSQVLTNDNLFSLEQKTSNIGSESSAQEAPTIVEEIAELDLKQHNVESKLRNLTASNKDKIIDIMGSLHEIHHENMVKFVKETETMSDELASPEIQSKFSTLSISDKLYSSLETNDSILSSVDSILDILELAALCRLCTLRGNYQESLEISTMVKSLMIRFPTIQIFQHINSQVEEELQTMVKGLLKLLSVNIKQSNIIKIFQILTKLTASKRLNTSNFRGDLTKSNLYLQMIYLNSRFLYICKEIDALRPLTNFNKMAYLQRFIETYREHIFNTLSCYETIFGNISKGDQEGHQLINQFIRKLISLLVDAMDKHFPHNNDNNDNENNKNNDLNNNNNDTNNNTSDDIKLRDSNEDGLFLQIIYFCKSLNKFNVNCETALVWELIYQRNIISEELWLNNLKKVKKFR